MRSNSTYRPKYMYYQHTSHHRIASSGNVVGGLRYAHPVPAPPPQRARAHPCALRCQHGRLAPARYFKSQSQAQQD